MASQMNQIEIVKLLLGAEGIEINQPMNDGFTPLGVATHNKHRRYRNRSTSYSCWRNQINVYLARRKVLDWCARIRKQS